MAGGQARSGPKAVEITRSKAKGKRYAAKLPSGKTVNFGAKGYQNYTEHGDEERRKSYLARHGGGKENGSDRESAGYWSRWLLWEEESLQAAARKLRSKGVDVKLKV